MAVYQRIFSGFAGKTIISSVHRLHLLRLFDRICLFEEGRIVAIGSLEELVARCPAFQVLWAQYSHRGEETKAAEQDAPRLPEDAQPTIVRSGAFPFA